MRHSVKVFPLLKYNPQYLNKYTISHENFCGSISFAKVKKKTTNLILVKFTPNLMTRSVEVFSLLKYITQ